MVRKKESGKRVWGRGLGEKNGRNPPPPPPPPVLEYQCFGTMIVVIVQCLIRQPLYWWWWFIGRSRIGRVISKKVVLCWNEQLYQLITNIIRHVIHCIKGKTVTMETTHVPNILKGSYPIFLQSTAIKYTFHSFHWPSCFIPWSFYPSHLISQSISPSPFISWISVLFQRFISTSKSPLCPFMKPVNADILPFYCVQYVSTASFHEIHKYPQMPM